MTATPKDELRLRLASAIGGSYRLDEQVGQGAMAIVYRAWDKKHERFVAVKVLKPEVTSPDGHERFLREVRTIGRLVHPNIVPLYHSDQSEGVLFYVMPFLSGETLADRLRREGALPVETAVGVAREIADALAYAHSEGVVHRDVKPSNILLTGGTHAALSDFGLAAVFTSASSRRLTHSGVTIGTPMYMSPEQIDAGRQVDGQADIYSLGCVLFEMLSGYPPFQGETVQAVLNGHLMEPPPSLTRLRPEVTSAIEEVVRGALEKNPRSRATADTFLAALEALGRSGPTVSDAGRFGRLYASSEAFGSGAPGATTVAVLPFVNRTGSPEYEYMSDGLTEELINTLAKVEGVKVAARTSSFAFKNTTLAILDIAKKLDVRTVVEGSIRKAGDRLRINVQVIEGLTGFNCWAETFERGTGDVFAIQEEISRAVVTALLGTLDRGAERVLNQRSTEQSEAFDHYLLGRFNWGRRTPEALQQAVEHFKKAIEHDPDYARAYAGLADSFIAMSQFQYRNPHKVIPLAELAARRALELAPTNAEAQSTYGHVLACYLWEWGAAEYAYRRAIKLDPTLANARIWLASLLTALSRFDEALDLAASTVEMEPFAVPIRFQYGTLLYRSRQYEEAAAEFRRILEMDPTYFATTVFLAFTYAAAGDPEQGVAVTRQTISRLRPIPQLLMPLAYCCARAGEEQQAREALDQLEQAATTVFVPAANRSIAYGALGDLDKAFALLDQALEEKFGQFIFVAVDPVFDPVRHDPRFDAILAAMRLPQSVKGTRVRRTDREAPARRSRTSPPG